jgi:GT2 family glycosyltransferase
VELEVFLTDDASSDGTAAAVKTTYPGTNTFNGTGSLFWAGGMRETWKKAMPHNPDYFLLVNDDTLLAPNAVATLLDAEREGAGITVGSTCDTSLGAISYGGWELTSKSMWKSRRVHSASKFLECDFANANIMLVSAAVVNKLGILAAHFTHSLADYDYTLKAKKAGFPVRVAPGFLGSCADDHGNNWRSGNTSLRDRIRYLKSPKGLAYKEYLRFIRDHFPLSLPSAFAKLWLKTFFPFIWDNLKK